MAGPKSPLSEIDRRIVQVLVETRAINFEALGEAIKQLDPASLVMEDDGWDRICGTNFRLYRWPRASVNLEELVVLRDIVRELPRRG